MESWLPVALASSVAHFARSLLAGRYVGFEHCDVTVIDKLTYASDRANLPACAPPLDLRPSGDICDRSCSRDVVAGERRRGGLRRRVPRRPVARRPARSSKPT